MRKWRVIQKFYLGEEIRIKDKDKSVDNFLLGIGSIIYESTINDRVIINGRVYFFKIGHVFTRFCELLEDIPENQVGDTNASDATSNFIWVQPTELVEIIPGRRYMTPDHFHEASLCVGIRGLLVSRENTDGFIVISDNEFELKRPLTQPNDWVMAGYEKKNP